MMTAATAAIAVIPNPSNGLCPWLTAKEVITPAPSPAITNEPTQSLLELLYIKTMPLAAFRCLNSCE